MLSGKATLSVMQISALPGGLRLVSGSAILLPLLADILAVRDSVYRVSFSPISRQRNWALPGPNRPWKSAPEFSPRRSVQFEMVFTRLGEPICAEPRLLGRRRFHLFYMLHFGSLSGSRSGELRTQKFKSHLVRTQSLNVLPWKSEVGQCVAIHATLTARDFFLAYFYPSGPFTRIFSKTCPDFSCVGCS